MSRNWAICIGINDYYNTTKLRYAVQDASAMRDFLEKEAAAFEEVFYFADDSPPIETPQGPLRSEPTRANLLCKIYYLRSMSFSILSKKLSLHRLGKDCNLTK